VASIAVVDEIVEIAAAVALRRETLSKGSCHR
jgi:hypothetical protein